MAYFADSYPVLGKSANLALTEDQEKYCRVVYKLDDKGGACFTELWNPSVEYSDEYVIVPIRSSDAAVETVAQGTKFANVKYSTRDPYPQKYKDPDHPEKNNWMHLWILLTKSGFVENCSTDGRFYYIDKDGTERTLSKIYMPQKSVPQNAQCCVRDMRGGHVLLNATIAERALENAAVYIIPICNNHNVASNIQGGDWGTGFYMRLKEDTKALILTGYLHGVKKYLKEFKEEVRHE